MRFTDKLRRLGVFCASRRDLRIARNRFALHDLVQIHHVIPRFCALHPTVRTLQYDIDGPSNFVLMPTHRGVRELRLRPDRLVHDGGHMAYCSHVWDRLYEVEDEEQLLELVATLHRGMRRTDASIPWRTQSIS